MTTACSAIAGFIAGQLPGMCRRGVHNPKAIIEAINERGIMVLVSSSYSHDSPSVIRELSKAESGHVPLITFRIEDVTISIGIV